MYPELVKQIQFITPWAERDLQHIAWIRNKRMSSFRKLKYLEKKKNNDSFRVICLPVCSWTVSWTICKTCVHEHCLPRLVTDCLSQTVLKTVHDMFMNSVCQSCWPTAFRKQFWKQFMNCSWTMFAKAGDWLAFANSFENSSWTVHEQCLPKLVTD